MDEAELQRFFFQHLDQRQIFDELYAGLRQRYPNTRLRILKTQINFLDPVSYAIVSLPRRKVSYSFKAPLLLSLGLPFPIEHERVFHCTKIHERRWTCHILLEEGRLDATLLDWIEQARRFAKIPTTIQFGQSGQEREESV